jgi:formamidopyrimidine-DNA glycosylase
LPELPEVEITRRHLESATVNRVIVGATVDHPRTARFNASAAEVESRLEGRRIGALGRHGKFLVATVDDGWTVLAHLGMSGRFAVTSDGEPRLPHTHVTITLDDGNEVRFIDPRTFGFVSVLDEDELTGSALSRLGPDAWDQPMTAETLSNRLAGRSAPIKALLLDQSIIAGLGNIYADESLHGAQIHPLTPGGGIGPDRAAILLEAIHSVLGAAISAGGTTLDDLAYLLPDGRAGENGPDAYGRDGLPCSRCGTLLERVVIRSRSTHYCPKCQT